MSLSEQEARSSLIELLDLFENGSAGLMLLSFDGKVVRSNRAQANLVRGPSSGAIDDDPPATIDQYLSPEDFEEIVQEISGAETGRDIELILHGVDGSEAIGIAHANVTNNDQVPLLRVVSRPLLDGTMPGGNRSSEA